MNYYDFLNKVIEDGISAAKKTYKDSKNQKLDGALAAFEACRNKMPEDLIEIYTTALSYCENARKNKDSENYWWFRCYLAEVEWVCNVVSAILRNQGLPPLLPNLPTERGFMKAVQILGAQNV
jgi:hypothetical protein